MFKENEPNRIAVRFFSRRILQCGVVRIYFFRIIATLFRARRAVGASLRGQTVVGGRARAKRPREAHSARTSLWVRSCRYKIPRQVDSIAHSICLFAARREAVSVGSNAWVLHAMQRNRRVSSRRQATTTYQLLLAFARIAARTINPFA